MARKRRRKRGKRRNPTQVVLDQFRAFAAGLVNVLEELEDATEELRQETRRRSDAARRANNTREGMPPDWPWDEDTIVMLAKGAEEVH